LRINDAKQRGTKGRARGATPSEIGFVSATISRPLASYWVRIGFELGSFWLRFLTLVIEFIHKIGLVS
jgi:hypothetical protein